MPATPAQTSFNGGELSRRLHARGDLSIYGIGLKEMTGWVALVEGGIDACPGTIRVSDGAGPSRLLPFEFNTTQGYLIEMAAGVARFFTNDARIEVNGVPVSVALPYTLPEIDELQFDQSYDVLYLFHPRHRTRKLIRTGADTFALEAHDTANGPFDPRNKDQSLVVSASGVAGDIDVKSSAPIFAATDVGGLFQVEADDFGDISSWEPGITVDLGQLLTWNERVYRVAGGSAKRTGTVAPVHGEGIEWDGIGKGKDINKNDAGGVQLEYVCDRFGVMRITGYTNDSHVKATVLRRLPFTTASSYAYDGGYYDPDWQGYEAPDGAVTYQVGTWRWRFGSFSDTRGWPRAGVIWNERQILAKDSTLYASVAGDLANHATRNEEGDISADMAFVYTLQDPNPVLGMIADERLKIVTGSGCWAGGPSNAAAGVGPGNFRADRQNNEGAAPVQPISLDGRMVYVGKSRRRVIEGDYAASRDRQDAIDLSRYARHIGQPRFLALVSQKDPNRMLWALRADGTLACATYVPEEQVLGWATRPLAAGMVARSIASISDPSGELNQLWISASYGGSWHILRLDQFRQEDDPYDPVMTDLSATFAPAAPSATFGPMPWLAGKTVDVVQADAEAGAVYRDRVVDAQGMVGIPDPVAAVSVGLPFPARIVTLRPTAGSESGGSIGKTRRIGRLALDVLRARGLRVTVQGTDPRDLEQLLGDSVANEGFAPVSGTVVSEDTGTYDRIGEIAIERVAPVGATIRAIQPTLDMR